MKPAVVIHNDQLPGSLEFARIAGMIESISPMSNIADGMQYFEKDNARQVSAYLFTTVPFWPDGTLFVSLVGQRRSVAVELGNGSIILSPDNGTATMCLDLLGFKSAVLLDDQQEYGLIRAAGQLLNGCSLSDIGKPLDLRELKIFSLPDSVIEDGFASGEIGMLLKAFGNITFTIKTADFEKTNIRFDDLLHVTITKDKQTVYDEYMPYEPSFGYVPVGKPVIFNGSSGYMDIGLNQESFINTCLPELLSAPDISQYKVTIRKVASV